MRTPIPRTHSNAKTLASRIGQAVLVLLITYSIAFLLLTALPSDGIMARYADPSLGLSLTEIQQIRDESGVDRPLIVRYVASLAGFFTGNFGYSIQSGTAVGTLIKDALPGTLLLAFLALALAIIIALVLAVLAASDRIPTLSRWVRGIPGLLVSLPSFWVGVVLIQVASFQLGIVPVIEPSKWESLILPTLTLAIPISAPLSQVLIRSGDETKGEPFIQVVRARGASESWVLWRNVIRGALVPTVTMAGLVFGELIGGAVVTEAVFGRQGIGKLTVDAVASRDTPVLLAVVVVTAAAYVLINLIVDLMYPIIDPRLRHPARADHAATPKAKEVDA